MKKTFLLSAFLLLASGTTFARESKHIHENTDPYSGITTLTLEVDTHTCPDDASPGPYGAQIHLLISATQYAPHDVGYNLTTDVEHSSIKPSSGAVMDTLIDGLPAQLPLAGPRSKWRVQNSLRRGHHTRETIPYEVSLAYLTSLADAKMFQFRINGHTSTLQRCSAAKQLRDLHEFLDAAAAY